MQIKLLSITPNADNLIERAGRTCYKSESKPDKIEDFIEMLITAGHTSVLEHACATFRISGVSRALSHQLVRHRLMSVSQQSQRYVKETNFEYVTPHSVPYDKRDEYHQDMNAINAMYVKWLGYGLKKEDARFFLPNACCTELVITANFREYRHIFQERLLNKHAQWEIRDMCKLLLQELVKETCCFDDIYVKEQAKYEALI